MNTVIEPTRATSDTFRLDAMLASVTPAPHVAAPAPAGPPEGVTGPTSPPGPAGSSAVAKRGPFTILLENRRVWLPPLLAEYSVLVCSITLSWFFMAVVQGRSLRAPLAGLAMAGACLGAFAIWVRVRELFMPRPVILFGIVPPMVLSGLVIALGFLESRWAGQPIGLAKRGVILLPFFVFLARGQLILQGARFAPRIASLDRHSAKPAEMFASLKKIVGFWLS